MTGRVLVKDFYGKVINLGGGIEVSIEETIEVITEAMGVNIEMVTGSRMNWPECCDVLPLLAENTGARELFGWLPNKSNPEGLRYGIADAID